MRLFSAMTLAAVSTAALVLGGCATDDDDVGEPIELTNDAKADGRTGAVMTIEPGRSSLVQWTCRESFDLNGCETKLDIEIAPPDGIPIAAVSGMLWIKQGSAREFERVPLVGGVQSFTYLGERITGYSARIENTAETSIVVVVSAEWW